VALAMVIGACAVFAGVPILAEVQRARADR